MILLDALRRSWLGQPLLPGENILVTGIESFALAVITGVAGLLIHVLSGDAILPHGSIWIALALIVLYALLDILRKAVKVQNYPPTATTEVPPHAA